MAKAPSQSASEQASAASKESAQRKIVSENNPASASKSASDSKPAGKQAASSRETTSRETVKSLHRYVDRIAIRLERADQQTADNIKALQSAFSLLERQVSQGSSSKSDALDAKVSQLSGKLNQTVEQTRASIKTELSAALGSANIDALQTALKQAENQLTEMELEQAEALARINGHIAKMATAIDARFKREAEQRQQELETATAKLETAAAKLEQKISTVETANGQAIRQIGDNIVDVTEKITSRADKQSALLKERVIELAKQTEKDIGTGFKSIEKRLDSLTDKQRHLDAYVDRSMTALGNRIDSLEYGLSTLPSDDLPSISSKAASAGDAANTAADIADAFSPPQLPPANSAQDNPYLAEANPNHGDAQSPDAAQRQQGAALNAPQEQAYEEQLFGQKTPSIDSAPHGNLLAPPAQIPTQPPMQPPVQPLAYQPPSEPPLPPQGYASGQAPAFDYQMPYDMPYQAANPASGINEAAINYAVSGAAPAEFIPEPVPLDNLTADDLPYENPAYGEAPSGLSRPGQTDEKTGKKKKKKTRKAAKISTKPAKLPKTRKSLITSRNIKVAALATALAAIGFVGLRGYIDLPGGKLFDNSQAAPSALPGSAPVGIEGGIEGGNVNFTDPIGDYQDNDLLPPSEIKDGPAAQLTLQEAAKSGNPVAQFQLGVNYLEAGQKPEAIKLIQQAANQNLPAAQYRLAKLYEAGIGVAADPDTARQLTERAARQGNRIAMHDLALYFAEGRGGVDMDLAKAAKWFERAAQFGVVDSQFNLGVLYESGQGVEKNQAKAYQWYTIAGRQGDQFAQQRLGILSTQMLTEEIDQAKAQADAFKPKAIDEVANGIFRNVPWAFPRADRIKPSAEIVKDAQSLLTGLGYDPGGADGSMGPKTRNAVLNFQRASGLPETGAVNAQLIDRLQAASGA